MINSIFIPKDFWHGTRALGSYFKYPKKFGYYIDFRHKTKTIKSTKVRNGIPQVRVYKNKFVIHPVTVAQLALGWYDRWVFEGKKQYVEEFIRLADILCENSISDNLRGTIWPIPYPVKLYGLEANWISSLVQGQAISTLARAFCLTNKNKYKMILKNAIQPFMIEVDNGGVLRYDEWKNPFYEEYPSKRKTLVLNGMISSLFGLYDYYKLMKNDKAKYLYETGIKTVLLYLPRYDLGYWSKYSLFSFSSNLNLASHYYHQEHICQLTALYLLSKNDAFFQYANQWKKYQRNLFYNFIVLFIKSYKRLIY